MTMNDGVRIQELEQENLVLRQKLEQAEGARSRLESLLAKRTAELSQVVSQLEQETCDRQQSDEALAKSEVRFQTIATTIPGAIFQFSVRDGQWMMDYISDRVHRIMGVTAAEIMEDLNCFTACIHPDDRDRHKAAIETAIANLTPWHFEGRVIKADNTIGWWQGDSTPAINEAGEIIFCGVLSDISDRKHSEEKLRHSQQKLSLLFEQTPLAIIEWNSEREIQEWNPAAERIFGYQRQEAIGRPFGFLVPDEIRKDVNQVFDNIYQNQPSDYAINENLTKDGKTIICEWYNVPLIASNGQIVGSASLALDISERKQAEAKLQEREEFLRSIFNGAQQAIFVIDVLENSSFQYSDWNCYTEELLGIKGSEAIGKTPEDIFGISQGTVLREYYKQCLTTHSTVIYEELLILSEQPSWWFTTLNPLKDDTGKVYRIVGTALNISDRKQAEALLQEKNSDLEQTLVELQHAQTQLIQSEKMSSLGQLVAGVAHEINNPVNFIHGNLSHANDYTQDLIDLVELYQTHVPNPPAIIQATTQTIDLDFLKDDLPKVLSSMKVGSERIREIVRSLRSFSRLDEAEFKAVDIHEGIDSTLMILQSRLKAKPDSPNVQILKEYGTLPLVDCYPGQLNQVLMNIISNAIDALEEAESKSASGFSPQITIGTCVISDNQIKIQIADNGSGMNEQVRSRLFDPFFTTKTVGKGTGLGLSISYQIVTEKHSGRLTCQSAPGQGAKFIIEIPIHQTSRKG
jgi:PAS domain S-box-containing protein